MDINQTNEYLQLIAGTNANYTFQTFPDLIYNNTTTKILYGTVDEHWEELAKLNRNGAGISVTVNETDGRGRNTKNIIRVRTVWQDDDKAFTGRYPLEPTLVVETSPGKFHRYWVIDPACDGMSFETFHKVMSVLTDKYGNDPNAKDLPRVLRLPGTMNMKSSPGHPVKIVGGTKQRYPASVISKAFGADTVESAAVNACIVSKEETGTREWDPAKVSEAMSFLPSEDRYSWFRYGVAIYQSSGGSHEGYQIWDKWSKTTSAGNYDPDEQKRHWNKIFGKRSDGLTVATIYRDAMINGWKPRLSANDLDSAFEQEEEKHSYADFSRSRVDGDAFPEAVIEKVKERFDGYRHSPSKSHWNGLTDIAKVYHRMATGTLPPSYYLSSLPCGMGKTTVATECTKMILNWDAYSDAGVIYFLSRLEEINTLVTAMELAKDDFSVLVSKSREQDVRDHGNPVSSNARVLFTTQQQLEARSKDGGSFADISEFHYRGKPRAVRVWDEAIVPSRVLTIERYGIDRLKASLKDNGHVALADTLDDWSYGLKAKDTGDVVEVPEVNSVIPSLENFRSMFKEVEDRDRAETLWSLSGRSVRIRRDNQSGATTLDYEDNLPEDLAPMLILDASGGLRKTYSFWETHRKGLVRLHSPKKSYGGLTIHHWNRGAGKSANKDWKKAREIAQGVARAINTEVPLGEECLVIFHKPSNKGDPNMEKMVDDQLNPKSKVHFCNWGKHTATNQYAHIKHVILAGILQYNDAQYEAVGRASKKARTEDEFGDDDFQSTRFGEIAHNIFQAACRGAVRKTVEGDCPEGCHLYIIFSTDRKRGFSREGLKRIFLKAPIVDWEPIEKGPSGKATVAIDFIKKALLSTDRVSSSEVMSEIGVSDASNFSKRFLNNPEFLKALEAAGIFLQKGRGRGGSYFQRVMTPRALPWTRSAPVEPLPF